MSWLISRALMEAYANSPSSLGLVEEYLAGNCSDGERFAPLNSTHTPQAFLPPDRMTAFSRPSRFGMTFAPLTEDRGAELLTWFLAGFRAKTLAAQTAKERVLTGPGRASGQKWRGLLAKFDRDSYSSRTAQGSSQGGSTECCATLPRWGSMRDGECLALTTPEHLTSETACGYWLPTPNASDHIQRKTSKSWAAKGRVNYVLSNPEITGVHGGRLNPEWTEWLMGWPLGWTDLKPLEMAKFREWQQQHGGC